ncbi:tetrapyrrole biosynthesis uroporphyrinogen III synthase [Sparassis crispa]|uniref:Tetrapyrrole biosynthesis uroporphyrinogen III synthase n=1 Tax=Sparassis crispa TaxID=139825 RepID=A0A401GXR1_9APHY|nr:tetrapyrrole biosynthesis uroporphyrinogen III synthase [Sparassis crispa]GBE87008.1 tetrapyrrole biosynthesis uroporphyrinogen III synthase [Sparassis crispa]
MANVLLLRAPSQDGGDKYEDNIRTQGYTPVSVPVLETVLKNLPALKEIIQAGHSVKGYAGVIITSGRACEAWRTAVQELVSNSANTDWATVPFYVVGEATAKALEEIREAVGGSPFTPKDIRGRAESGTSERLAHFILDDLSSRTDSGKLLYLTGDKNRDTSPKILKEGGFDLEPLQVYETQGSSNFPADLQKALNSVPTGRWWIVYFAPSAAEFVTPTLRKHFDLRSIDSPPDTSRTIPSVAAIGPTTSTFLREQLSLHVRAVPSKPTPEALVAAIVAADSATSAAL